MAVFTVSAMNAAGTTSTPVKNVIKKSPTANVDGINFKLDAKNNRAKVVSGTNLYSGDVVIPEKFTEDSVTYYVEEIDGGAFKDCVTLVNVTIPTTITKIGSDAFKNCSTIESITIPNSISVKV